MALFTGIPDPAIAGGVQLEGLVGPVEAVLDLPAEPWRATPRAIALCCHPHPLFGGSLTNKVIHTVARSCVTSGAVALRFNFRGVGRSAGVHDHGEGEALDVVHLAAQLRARWPNTPLWLAGFSFGAWISLRVARQLAPQRLLTIAPPVGRWDFSDISPPDCPWLIIQGDRDELVDPRAVQQWAAGFEERVSLTTLPEADHFFHGQLLELRAAVEAFLANERSMSAEPRKI
jgi:hypothetical protein